MKKLLLSILLAIGLTTSAIGLVACGEEKTEEDAYHQTYNLYVTYAKENDISPLSYEDWLATIKGKDGKDGQSAYELYKKYHTDYTKTEEEFINDLINGELGGTLKETLEDLAKQIADLQAQLEEISKNPGHTHSYVDYVSNHDATCEEDGTKTATCEHCSATKTIVDEGSKLGHNYGTPTYTWSEDKKTCTAEVICRRDTTHKVTETVNANFTVTQSRVDGNDELSTATATFTNEIFTEQVKTGIVTDIYERLATESELNNLTLSKNSNYTLAKTVGPNGQIKYTISIKNNNKTDVFVNISDTLPAKTSLISGCDNENSGNLSWSNVLVENGETKEITYVVRVDYTLAEVKASTTANLTIAGQNATVMTKTITYENSIYVKPSFNQVDEERIERGLQANADANSEYLTVIGKIKMAYITGFTNTFTLEGSTNDAKTELDNIYTSSKDLDLVIPSIYGGTNVSSANDKLFIGARATSISKDDLLSGDIIITESGSTIKVYVFYRGILVDYSTDGVVDFTADYLSVVNSGLSSYSRYVGLRPSYRLATNFSFDKNALFNENDENLTDAQLAVVKTAYQYLARGTRVQYNDNATSKPFGSNGLMREQIKANQPEYSTTEDNIYTNCAMFCYDVFYTALGLQFKAYTSSSATSTTDIYTTSNVATVASLSNNANVTALYLTKTKMTNMTLDQIKETVFSTLQPGDELTIRRSDGSGHALLYVGNGYIIHSSGSSFNVTESKETYECSIRIETILDMFDKTNNPRQYIPDMNSFSIVRPLNLFTSSVPQNTTDRINNLENIISEKLCSVPFGNTVNIGDEITYTYKIRNLNNEAKTITIKDIVPANTSFVSISDNGVNSSGNLTWEFTVDANAYKTVSYTVKVSANTDTITRTASNTITALNGTVNGVKHKCHGLTIANTLTEAQQQTLLSALSEVKKTVKTSNDGVVTANAIYKQAFGTTNAMSVDSLSKLFPFTNNFEVDDTKIGYIVRGSVGGDIEIGETTTTSIAKPVDVTGKTNVAVYHNKRSCSLVVLGSDGKILEKKDYTTSDNYNTYTLPTGATTLYLSYAKGYANDFALFTYVNANERKTGDEALFVRYTLSSYVNSLYTYMINSYSKASLMVAPSLYGGYSLIATNYNSKSDVLTYCTETRMRMFYDEYLVVGDIFFEYTWAKGYGTGTTFNGAYDSTSRPHMYMYVGDNKLVSIMGDDIYTEYDATKTIFNSFYRSQLYAVLRPSMQNDI